MVAELVDGAGLLSQRDELVGSDRAEFRMSPPEQRFDAADAPGREVHDRLVSQRELSQLGSRNLFANPQSPNGRRTVGRGEVTDPVAVPLQPLGLVHRGVGVCQQFLGGVRGLRRHNAHAGRDDETPRPDVNRVTESVEESLRERVVMRRPQPRCDNSELIAAESRDHIVPSDCALEA